MNITASADTVYKPSAYYKKAIKEVLEIVDCKRDYKYGGIATFTTPLFYIRVLDKPDNVLIQLGVKKTFDRWANSVNFVTERSKGKKHYFSLFKPQYKWATKVLKSKLFDFQNYSGSIELPRIEFGRNK